jgi:hypothetical protein
MKSCLHACSSLLAAICAFLFVTVSTLILVIFIADRLLFNAEAYKLALRNQHIYDRMPGLAAEQLIYEETHPNGNKPLAPELKRLTQSDWEIMLSEILTAESLQTQAESVIDQFFSYLNTPSKPLELKVSLVDFKEKLDGEEGFCAIMRIVNAQPACDSEEWAQIVSGSQSAQFEDLPFCRPSEEVLASAESYIRASLHDLVATIPDETYLDENQASSSSTTTKDDPRADLQRAHRWIWLSLCLPAFLILLVAVFGVRSFTGCGLWLGLPLVFTGLFTFVAAVVTWVLPGWLITRNAPGGKATLEGVAPGVTQALVDVGNSLAHITASTVGIVAILLIMLGLGVLAVGFLFRLLRRSNLL